VKTLHVSYSFAPDAVGGTEVYVEGLCRSLAEIGVEAMIAAPAANDASYEHRGLRVRRFATGGRRLEDLYGPGDSVAARAFERILDAERPDVVHQHAVSPACSVELMRAADRRGVPVVFTYHTPTASCSRGTLVRWGSEICDGRLASAPCTACTLHGLGAGRLASAVAGGVPPRVGVWLGHAGLRGGLWTAARMPALIRLHHASVAELFAIPARIVSLAPWVTSLLEANGVPPATIVNVRHGTVATPRCATERRPGPCRFVHLGRLDPAKGTELLLAALRAIPGVPCELDVMGITQDERSLSARRRIEALARGDARIRILDPVESCDVVDRLADYDFVVVPSQWLETGPMVALEAFAAGVPVIGSALGGLPDQITDNVDGLLVRPFSSVRRWADVLRLAALDRALGARLRSGVRPPRAMAVVAEDMRAIYADVLGARPRSHAVEPVMA
jgi:glycosyltransferase involved in cell wall biosynthesis